MEQQIIRASRRSRANLLTVLLIATLIGACESSTGDVGQSRNDEGRDARPADAVPDADALSDADAPPDAEAGAGLQSAGAVCATTDFGDRDEAVLVGSTPDELVWLKGDGQVSVVHTFGQGVVPTGLTYVGQAVPSPTKRLIAAYRSAAGQVDGESHVEVVLFEANGARRWHYENTLEGYAYVIAFALSDRGSAAFTFEAPANATFVVLPDGSAGEVPVLRRPAAPRADGWVPGYTSEYDGSGYTYTPAFVRTGSSEYKRLSHTEAPAFTTLHDGNFYYTQASSGSLVLVRESPSEVVTFPIGVQLGPDVRWSERRGLIIASVAGVPVWRFDLSAESGVSINLSGLPTDGSVETRWSDDWMLLAVAGIPRFRLNMRSAESFEVSANASLETGVINLGQNVWWGSRDGWPLWYLNATTGDLRALSAELPAGWRRITFEGYCEMGVVSCAARVFDDGTITVGLRNDYEARLFLLEPGSDTWLQLGHSVAHTSHLAANRTGPTWTITSARIDDDTFCPIDVPPYTNPPQGAEQPLIGGVSQVVSDALTEPLVFEQQSMLLHPSGLCGMVDSKLYDLTTGDSIDVGFRGRFWLPAP